MIYPELLEFCGEQRLLSARVTAIQKQQVRDIVSLDLVFQFFEYFTSLISNFLQPSQALLDFGSILSDSDSFLFIVCLGTDIKI